MLDCQNSFYGAKIVINVIFNKNMCHFNHFDTSFSVSRVIAGN